MQTKKLRNVGLKNKNPTRAVLTLYKEEQEYMILRDEQYWRIGENWRPQSKPVCVTISYATGTHHS